MIRKSILAMLTGGVFSLLMLSACNESDPMAPTSQSAKVKGKGDTATVVIDTKPVDTTTPWCGTPDGTDPMDIPHTGGPVAVDTFPTVDPKPVVTDGFEPIDWTAVPLPGSEGWECRGFSPPVCATNGKTYRNVCEAAWSGLKAASEGACKR